MKIFTFIIIVTICEKLSGSEVLYFVFVIYNAERVVFILVI